MSHDPARPRQRVLVVDDTALVAMCFRHYLDKLRHSEVVAALSGAEALLLFAESPFDVLVTDRMMPGMNGVALAERVRQLYPGTVMIMVTAFIGDALDDPQARDLFEHILVKPVDMDGLRRVVSEALERGRQAIGDREGSTGSQPEVKGGMPSEIRNDRRERTCSAGFQPRRRSG